MENTLKSFYDVNITKKKFVLYTFGFGGHVKKLLVIMLCLLVGTFAWSQDVVEGYWKSVDENGVVTAGWKIYEKNATSPFIGFACYGDIAYSLAHNRVCRL